MLAFLLSLIPAFMAPTALVGAVAAPAPAVAAPAPAMAPTLPWMSGTWRSGGLEMRCAPRGGAMACREEGTSGPMQGAAADLTFAPAGAATQLTLALPSIPPSIFTQVAQAGGSATFEMKTPGGIARLRFTRTGDALKIERGNGDGWGSALTYQRG